MKIGMSGKPWTVLFGECSYDAAALRSPRAEAWIAAAGPAVSLALAMGLGWGAVASGLDLQGTEIPTNVLLVGSFGALMQFLFSALPIRYGAGLGDRAGESDGRAIWRIVTGAPPGGVAREERRLGRPERAARPAFVVLGLLIAVLAVAVDPPLGAILVAVFGGGLWLQRAGASERG